MDIGHNLYWMPTWRWYGESLYPDLDNTGQRISRCDRNSDAITSLLP